MSFFSRVSCGRIGREIEEKEMIGLLGQMSTILEMTILVSDLRLRIYTVKSEAKRKENIGEYYVVPSRVLKYVTHVGCENAQY